MDGLTQCWIDCTVNQDNQAANVATIECFECVFQGILNVILRFAGVALFVMIIVGGFVYLGSGGDPKKAQLGRNIFTYAIVGLVFLILAWFILLFIQEFTGVEVTVFNLRFGEN